MPDYSAFISTIKQQQLPKDQYYPEVTEKRQIVLHHTAGSGDPVAAIGWWQQNQERVGVSFVIGGYTATRSQWKNGDIYQAYSSKYWAHHLYVTSPGNKIEAKWKTQAINNKLNSQSVGIEICNYGPLTPSDKGYKTYVNSIVPDSQVVELGDAYRGYKYYHKYSDEQLDSAMKLLQYLCDTYDIPRKINGDIFSINQSALSSVPGIYSHVSYRTDKNDCSPQPALITMINSL